MTRVSIVLLAVVASTACGMSEEEEACHDVIEWFGQYVWRCHTGTGAEKDAVKDGVKQFLEQQIRCEEVESVRDRDELYTCCRAWFEQAPCVDLSQTFPTPPACCAGQLRIEL